MDCNGSRSDVLEFLKHSKFETAVIRIQIVIKSSHQQGNHSTTRIASRTRLAFRSGNSNMKLSREGKTCIAAVKSSRDILDQCIISIY